MCEIWRSQLEPKDVIDPDTVKHFPVKSCLQPVQGGFAPWLIALSAGILLQLLFAPAAVGAVGGAASEAHSTSEVALGRCVSFCGQLTPDEATQVRGGVGSLQAQTCTGGSCTD